MPWWAWVIVALFVLGMWLFSWALCRAGDDDWSDGCR